MALEKTKDKIQVAVKDKDLRSELLRTAFFINRLKIAVRKSVL